VVRVSAGSVLEFVNVDLAEHSALGAAGDSGALRPGESYRLRLGALGTYTFADAANPLNTVVVVVENVRLFLPLILR
jgi:hypothetical protein